jgi:hypothetical protein
MCGNNHGSLISKNVIRNSSNRCIVLDGTNDVILSYNAAFNTTGHCYALEDGSEMRNVFESNIGFLTKAAPKYRESERDNAPAIFFITNPQNHFRGNVAAGSDDSGFILLFQRSVVGDSEAFYPEMIPQQLHFQTFENNIGHSNRVAGFKMAMVLPQQKSILKGMKAYRNLKYGLYLYGVNNMEITNAYIADNLCGIGLNKADNIVVTKSSIIGISDVYKTYVAASKLQDKDFCREGAPHQIGLQLHPILYETASIGPKISRVRFVNYGPQNGCAGGVAIELGSDVINASFEPRIQFKGITFISSSKPSEKFSLCGGIKQAVNGVYIEDDGSLNPSIDAKPGYIILDEDNAPHFSTKASCSPMGEGTCAKYCTGECLRVVKLILSSQDTSSTKVNIIEESDSENKLELIGEVRGGKGRKCSFVSLFSHLRIGQGAKIMHRYIYYKFVFVALKKKAIGRSAWFSLP